ANGAHGDDTLKLKTPVSEWVNREFKPLPPVDHDNKHLCGFAHDVCGKLLCPAELGWDNPEQVVHSLSRDPILINGYIVTDLYFSAFLYDKDTTNPNDLEEGLFKGKLLIQSYKAVFISPSSAKDVEGNSNGADVISNNRWVKKSLSGIKVKKHVVQIIHMDKVTPCSITYIACQVSYDTWSDL
ncbi:hypothetical protein EV702DRAFT_978404, partial [Suillus placidus]